MKLEFSSGEGAVVIIVLAILLFLYSREKQRQVFFTRNPQGQYEIPNLGIKLNYGAQN